MKRNYIFKWYKTKDAKYGEPITRTTNINLTKPVGRTEIDTKAALQLFIQNFGNLNKNTIVSIKELDGNNQQIGEDIVPSTEEDAIIPIGR